MKRVQNLEQYSTLVDECIETYNNIIYNCMLLPKEINEIIKKSKLYYEKINGGIVFFRDEKDFYKLYLFISEDIDIKFDKKEKPQVIECIYTDKLESINFEQIKKKIKKAGFKFYTKNIRVKTFLEEYNEGCINDILDKDGLWWEYLTSEEYCKVYELWSSLDKYNSIIPRKSELLESVDNKRILCIKNKSGICAVAQIKEESRKVASIWLVAVDERSRRKGIATNLYRVLLYTIKKSGYSFAMQWCDQSNEAIIQTVYKLGFQFDTLKSKSYILE